VERRIWFDRRFVLGTPIDAQPDLVERLRGTPLRLEERVAGLPLEQVRLRPGDSWSIAEHAGHLGDLERLWLGRIEDFLGGLSTLRPADLANRATWAANHNARLLEDILSDFGQRRHALVEELERLNDTQLQLTAHHPRLEQPMTVVDLCFFVAEHDDHHLAAITALRGGGALRSKPSSETANS